jgi:hypothetical protein
VLGLAGAAAGGSSLAACANRSSPSVLGGGPTSSSAVPAASAPSPTHATASTPAPSASPPAGPDITHGPRTGRAVALTFHGNGPEAIVRQVVAALHRADASVTVLAVLAHLHDRGLAPVTASELLGARTNG